VGQGIHHVRADGAAPRSGLYFARLTQAGEKRIARVSVFR